MVTCSSGKLGTCPSLSAHSLIVAISSSLVICSLLFLEMARASGPRHAWFSRGGVKVRFWLAQVEIKKPPAGWLSGLLRFLTCGLCHGAGFLAKPVSLA